MCRENFARAIENEQGLIHLGHTFCCVGNFWGDEFAGSGSGIGVVVPSCF